MSLRTYYSALAATVLLLPFTGSRLRSPTRPDAAQGNADGRSGVVFRNQTGVTLTIEFRFGEGDECERGAPSVVKVLKPQESLSMTSSAAFCIRYEKIQAGQARMQAWEKRVPAGKVEEVIP